MYKWVMGIIAIGASFSLGCKKNSPGQDANPCNGSLALKAELTVNEVIEGTNRVVPVDTIVNFQALLKASSNGANGNVAYEWLVNADGATGNRYTQQEFMLRFGPEWMGRRLNVRLIARRSGAAACRPQDNIDTVYRHFYVYTNNKADTVQHRPYIVENKITGRWWGGYTDAPDQKFMVTVADFGFAPVMDSIPNYGVRLFNMPEGCGNRPSWASNPCAFAILPSSYSHPIEYGSRSFSVYQPYISDCQCKPVSLYGYIPYGQSDSLVMDVDFFGAGTGTVAQSRQWRGKRI